ncbi:hypothetical protein NDU88_001361 [Pleurodeles waltl]|uniref:Uncharacterized protein n=1 Tax=Pleurodeles waltl TaxID=8319 RepID=A0AAV7NAI7_PLEWA|nr:hypothetical protein NDU88_001361 [Pleurodeles waltl]
MGACHGQLYTTAAEAWEAGRSGDLKLREAAQLRQQVAVSAGGLRRCLHSRSPCTLFIYTYMLTASHGEATEVCCSDGNEPCRLTVPVPTLERSPGSRGVNGFPQISPSQTDCTTFDPPLEFQRVHRLGLRRPDIASRPRLIISCLLGHGQTRQLLQAARIHSPFRPDRYDIRITADYSKDTNDRRKAFLAPRPHLRQLEMKYGLFDPVRMCVTKNGVSKDFYDPEDLRLFLDTFQHQPMDTAAPARPQEPPKDSYNMPPLGSE